tara:strand:+ start:24032 stop:25288 length:1257 start_codon:yes stop_codon:yes gene_type:complete
MGNTLPGEHAPKAMGNGGFLRELMRALLALVASAALLITGYIVLSSGAVPGRGGNDSTAPIPPRIVTGSELSLRYGDGARGPDESFTVTDLAQDGRAIITRNLSLNAQDYPFLQVALAGAHPGESVYFIWKTANNPLALSNALLNWNGDKPTTYHLAKNPEWQGRITEIGFDIYGDMRGQPVVISGLSFLPANWRHTLSAIWSEWTAYRGWTQRSINFLLGTPKNPILSPTLAMASWSGLALLLLLASYLVTRRNSTVACLAAIAIPWISLDLLWQANISTQLEDTKTLFAGRTQHEKHLAGTDRELYSYAHYLKSEILPAAGAKRIFLLHDLDDETYPRLKAQYFLLPHNIYNYGRLPNKKKARQGDYILVLGKIAGLDYDPQKRRLTWGGKSLRVKLIDTHSEGQLYKVVARKKRA